MPTTLTRNDELEGLLRRAIDLADEVRPSFVMQRLLREALAALGVEDSGLPEWDPDPIPSDGPSRPPTFSTDTPRNLKPEAAEREKQAVIAAVKKARDARKEQLADPVETTAADLEEDPPEAELPTTDPNGPNHGQDPTRSLLGWNDNGSGSDDRTGEPAKGSGDQPATPPEPQPTPQPEPQPTPQPTEPQQPSDTTPGPVNRTNGGNGK